MPIRTVFARLTHRLRNPLTPGELRYASFWFSQLLMIGATILGVYLASAEGMKVAIQFNELTRMERNYYLRQSLANELEWNATMVVEYAEEIQGGIPSQSYFQMNPLALDQFVWRAMRESEATLETPSRFLSAAQQFYREVPALYQQLANRSVGASYGSKQLQAAAEPILEGTVPALRENVATLKAELEHAGMELN